MKKLIIAVLLVAAMFMISCASGLDILTTQPPPNQDNPNVNVSSNEQEWITWECEHCGHRISCPATHLPGICPDCGESDWKMIDRIIVSKKDTDGDWISDRLELELGTDPLKLDTDGDGIDDFNESYTYPHLLNPNDPTDTKEFLAKIPNVEAKGYVDADYAFLGDTESVKLLGEVPPVHKGTEVSKRDPLVRWYADRTQIQWTVNSNGTKKGRVIVNGEPYFQEYGYPEGDGISYFLTHKRKGVCGDYAWNLAVLLDLAEYQVRTLRVEFDEPILTIIDGETIEAKGHVWTEVIIGGQIYVIDFDRVMPQEEYYQRHSDWKPIVNHVNNWP